MSQPLLPIFLLIITILSSALILMGQILSPQQPDLNKLAPYECGFDPINSPRLPFSFRFFLVAILFLIFDLEIALLLVLPFAITLNCSLTSILYLFLFIIILTGGLYYEWVNGGLEWAND
uniref:NADH-ubiquinone oxidoreductase chain 3 n=2 Tax=Amphiuridae TaxID=106738 RepID=A0A9E8D0G9_9ECHI|nr:NADH dehydrogenase subunit 3 [Amphiura sp. CZ-2022]